MKSRRTAAGLAAALLSVALLAGCGEHALPTPQPRPTGEVVPVLGADQLDRILGRIVVGVADADTRKDVAALGAVADGPALAARTSAYTLSGRDAALPMPAALGGDRVSAAIPRQQEWPRTVLVVSKAGAEDPLPDLLLLTQAEPRALYKLTAYAAMIPRATFPVVPPLRDGLDVVAPDDGAGAVATPNEALAGYAKYLSEGAASPEAARFTSSPLTTAIIKAQDDSRTALTPPTCADCVTVAYAHAADPSHVWAFRTSDGGIIVLGQLNATTVMTSTGGVQTTLSQELRALSGRATLTGTGTFGYQEMVGLFIPPNGPRATITPIAFDRVPVAANVQ